VGKRNRAGLCACRKRGGVGYSRGSLLSVADQDLIAGSADSRPMALQAVENAENVVVGVFDHLLAKAHDVRTAGGAFSCIPLALSRRHRNGRSQKQSFEACVTPRLRKARCDALCHRRDWRDTPAQQTPTTFMCCVAIAHRRPPLRRVAAGG